MQKVLQNLVMSRFWGRGEEGAVIGVGPRGEGGREDGDLQ